MSIIEKNTSALGNGSTDGLDDTTITDEAKYSINMQDQGTNLVAVQVTMGAAVF